jgi:hypothetical protein
MLAELVLTLAEILPLDFTGRLVPTVPTLGEYLPQVIAAAGSGALHTYDTYWTRMATRWGDRRLDEITSSIGLNSVSMTYKRNGRTYRMTNGPAAPQESFRARSPR